MKCNNKTTGKKLYKYGWLGLIPLVGFFSGLVLLWQGLFKFKDRVLAFIGLGGMIITFLAYGFLYYRLEYSDVGAKDFEYFSQLRLNNLVKAIEFYKSRKSQYPDNLYQLQQSDPAVIIDDPIMFRGKKASNTKFNYKKTDTSYIVFSSGRDKIPNTADDIFPNIR